MDILNTVFTEDSFTLNSTMVWEQRGCMNQLCDVVLGNKAIGWERTRISGRLEVKYNFPGNGVPLVARAWHLVSVPPSIIYRIQLHSSTFEKLGYSIESENIGRAWYVDDEWMLEVEDFSKFVDFTNQFRTILPNEFKAYFDSCETVLTDTEIDNIEGDYVDF